MDKTKVEEKQPLYKMFANRVLKRVPLDFDWPLDKVWAGYSISPVHYGTDKGYKYDEEENTRCLQYVFDNLARVEPPKGKGFQCWETTSEGSPITPVFSTVEEVCKYLVEHPKGLTKNLTYEDWLKGLSEKDTMLLGSFDGEMKVIENSPPAGIFVTKAEQDRLEKARKSFCQLMEDFDIAYHEWSSIDGAMYGIANRKK